MMIIAVLLSAAKLDSPNASYAGLPQLSSPNSYRILTENVSINVGMNDRVRIASTTVYRNMGAATSARITLADGLFGSKKLGSKILATWDNQPISFQVKSAVAFADVLLGAEATHSLKLSVFGTLAKTGYAKDEYQFNYRLSGNHPIDLFSLAYRYTPGSVFGLPKVEPNLGWEIGPKGASIRKTDFNPSNSETTIQFYRNAMQTLGTGG